MLIYASSNNDTVRINDSEFTDRIICDTTSIEGSSCIVGVISIYNQRKLNVPLNLLRYYFDNYSFNKLRYSKSQFILQLEMIREGVNRRYPHLNYDKYHHCILRQYNLFKWLNSSFRLPNKFRGAVN